MDKVVVFGGSGFIGAEICNTLSTKTNSKVLCADNYSRNEQKQNINNNVEHIKCDITNEQAVLDVCRDADVVINLAFINGTANFYKRPRDVFKVALEGQFNVIKAISKTNVKRFIYASSSEVYQTPEQVPTTENVKLVVPDINNPRYSYGGGKIVGELMCVHYLPKDVSFQIFRPHNIYGPNMGAEHVIPELIEKIYRSKAINEKSNNYKITLQGAGESKRSFCFIKDFGNGFLKIWTNGSSNEIYNIGTQDEVPISKIAEILSQLSGKNLVYENEPLPLGSTKRRCPDITKIMGIGYKPEYSLEDGLKITNDWYLKTYE